MIKYIIDIDNETLDIPCNIETMGDIDKDIAITHLLKEGMFDKEKIHHMLESDDKITINIDINNGILILDGNNACIRELDFSDDFTSDKQERIKEIIHKLFILL